MRAGVPRRQRGTALLSCSRRLRPAAAALLAGIAAAPLGANADKTRTISFYNIHTKENMTVVYKKDGKYAAEAMDKIDWVLRDWRKDEAIKMDPELIDLLWEIHTELGSREPIHVVSGYRSRATNDMLRRSVGRQASQSRHILGQAADVHFPDVSVRRLRYCALIRERGGVGYYPTSATPFVHVDTGRVRHWPRLPRHELALLFPSGRTEHLPADGGSITPADARAAKESHKDLALQVAEFQDLRKAPKRPALIAEGTAPPAKPAASPRLAALTPPAPKLTTEPRLVAGPAPAVRPRPDAGPALASLADMPAAPRPATEPAGDMAGRTDWASGWAQAPAWDDEHPEELSYRPFPIAPYLTATASADDPALTRLVHPDIAKTLELLDQADALPPMRLRPGQQMAQLLWAQQFRGGVVNLDELGEAARPPAPGGLGSRAVKTK